MNVEEIVVQFSSEIEMEIKLHSQKEAQQKRMREYWVLFQTLQKLKDKQDIDRTFNTMTSEEVRSEMSILDKAKCRISRWIDEEKEWEKKTKELLDDIELEHPLVFRILVYILSSVIVGLLTSYIWEGIHLDQVRLYTSPSGAATEYVEIDNEHMWLESSEESKDFYKVIVPDEKKEKTIGYIKADDVEAYLEMLE